MAVTEYEKISGIYSKGGFLYQDTAVAHKFVIQCWDKIRYEQEGADYYHEYYDEEYTKKNVISFYQCKTIAKGAFTLYRFRTDIFPRFSDIFYDLKEQHIPLAFVLETNTVLERNLRSLIDRCMDFSDRSLDIKDFIESINKIDKKIMKQFRKGGKHEIKGGDLYRLLASLRYIEKQDMDRMGLEIFSRFKDIVGNRALARFEQLLGIIYQKKQGIITREELEKELGFAFKNQSSTQVNAELQRKVQDVFQVSSTTTLNNVVDRSLTFIERTRQMQDFVKNLEQKIPTITDPTLQDQASRDVTIVKQDALDVLKEHQIIKEAENKIDVSQSLINVKFRRFQERKSVWTSLAEEEKVYTISEEEKDDD